MIKTYQNLNELELNDCNNIRAYKKLIFSLSFFHAIVEERRKYGIYGFSNYLNFTNEDYLISIKEIKTILNQYENLIL